MTIVIAPLTPDKWPAFERLFGPTGASYGCWCTYFRVAHKLRKQMSVQDNKAFMKARVIAGPAPGILAMEGETAVGWLQVGPREDIPQWNSPRRVSAPLDDAVPADPAVWAMSCFFVGKTARKQGLTRKLVDGGIEYARLNGARIIESCPMDHSPSPLALFVGTSHVFRDAGFEEVALRKGGRPLMRLVI